MDDLRGRVALVTGGSRGIGQAIAIALAHAGCDVAIGYHARAGDAAATMEAIEATGQRAASVRADLALPAEGLTLVRDAEAALGPIEILINNAAILRQVPLDTMSLEDWQAVIDTNLTSAFVVSQAVLPAMRAQRWGRMIMLSSIAAQTGGVIGPHYAASKAGLIGLMHGYAGMLAKEGITANAIAPALIETDMVRNNPRARPDLLPVGRFGTVAEVADLTVAVVRNGYITGQTININGGWYMS